MRQLTLSLGLWAALLLPAAAAPSSGRVFILRATVVHVRLLQALSSKTAQLGDRVQAQVDDNDRSGLPRGAVLVGRVTEVQRASSTSTIKGVLLGAAAGYLYGQTQKAKNRDVNLKAGAEFGVRLNRQLAL